MGVLDQGPGYTVKDLVYYGGLFGGLIVVYLAGRPYGVHPLILLVGGIIVGVGVGYVLERLYERSGRG